MIPLPGRCRAPRRRAAAAGLAAGCALALPANASAHAGPVGRPRPVPAAGGPGGGLAAWSVPLLIGGRRAGISGVSRYAPAPPMWPWLIPLATTLAGSVLLVRRRSADDARAAARSL